MDNLYFRIKALHPTLEAGRDFELRDDADGQGAKIVRWRAAVPQPTEAELLAADWQAAVPDPADIDRIPKQIKAAVLAAAIMSGKTVAQAKAAFKQAWDALP
jgi:hypothetical protein